MPRTQHPAASTLRNRNRITNKTRLKIHQGSLDADAILIPDEDEEKHRLTNLVAGVDAEDANEHHLQEVLSAVHRTSVHRHGRGVQDKPAPPPPSAFIPTPDSTGIVDNYETLYPPNKWKDPATYVCTSSTVEEHIVNGLANGFTYYMDERDQEWLEKNNEEARGEGTSVQGAVSVSGTRTSARSAKAKGKEPEASQPVVITDDEFELVMGIFEKVTHERTEFLHHSLETGMDFPPFADYQDVFSAPLTVPMFATYAVPSWIPPPATLLKMAKTVYPYWKERRIERGGNRIIPTLNGDESDILNESYICFRRRENKAVRKTRAQQVPSSDKLQRLQMELQYPFELAKYVLARETMKREAAKQAQGVWEKRMAMVDLKRKYPSLGDKHDEELLIDKERPSKRQEIPRVPGLKLRASESVAPPPRQEIGMKPKERARKYKDAVDQVLGRIKEANNHWEDQLDNGYQTPPATYASKLFKYIPPPSTPSWPSSSSSEKSDEDPPAPTPSARAVRMRVGRGGRIILDRRSAVPRSIAPKMPRSSLFGLGDADEDDEKEGDESMDVDEDKEDPEEADRLRCLQERWRYDSDDAPPVGLEGPDEQDRVLVDDYNPKYLRHIMPLFQESDLIQLMNDPTIPAVIDGRSVMVMPFRLGMPNPHPQQRMPQNVRQFNPGNLPPNHPLAIAAAANGTPVSMQHQIKKMQVPTSAPQMRISSNGGMRPPSLPAPAVQTNGITPHHVSPPHPMPVPQHSPANGVNGISRAAISMPHVDVQKQDVITTPAISNGVAVIPPAESSTDTAVNPVVNGIANGLPARPKSQNVTPQSHLALGVPTSGYHLTPMTNMGAVNLLNPTPYQHSAAQQHLTNGLSQQQIANIKTIFNNDSAAVAALQQARSTLPASYMHVVSNGATVMNLPNMTASNLNLKLPAARQMQWMNAPIQRPASVANGMDVQLNNPLNAALAASPNMGHSVPVRSPSANGSRAGMRNGVHLNGMSPASHMQHSPTPLPNIAQSQSPPRVPMTPNMGMGSPALQQQQPVGGTQNGY
ncbi:hypothetical protein D9619_007669 [Psilocybe cf. subviscida]|uniref:Enhancer of polycomb-like protein n=1 Tax=Psilocybe cf. subviscida TaxID=2480587 RepID=A0A8H5ESH0_9AGAR|nr:hypothetical protein D9619_007669 [Psilocybe cf. subviscida]